MKRFAMFSAANEGKVPALAGYMNALLDRKFTILASGGTHTYLKGRSSGREITNIADLAGEAILNHRVVTLDRKLFAGVLSRIGVEEEDQQLELLLGGTIQVVHMDIYHLKEAIDREMAKAPEKCDWEAVKENIDIGGPSYLRAASKGGKRYVTSSPNEHTFTRILDAIDTESLDRKNALHAKCLQLELAQQAEYVCEQHSKLAGTVYGEMLRKAEEELLAA